MLKEVDSYEAILSSPLGPYRTDAKISWFYALGFWVVTACL